MFQLVRFEGKQSAQTLLLADGALTVGRGETLTHQMVFFTKTAVTREQKIVPKVGNERSLQGLQTGR